MAVVIIYFALNSTTKPIVKVSETLKDISEGEGDLTRTIVVNSKDEVGNLALYFNKTLDKIRNLIVIIRNRTVNLQGIGDDLASNMTETAAAINEINANINKLNEYVEKRSSNVSQASSAIEEMVANIASVTNTLVNNAANVINGPTSV